MWFEKISNDRKLARDGTHRGGARVGSGRPKGVPNRWPTALAKELSALRDSVEKLRAERRIDGEHSTRILARLVVIERHLGLRDKIEMPRVSGRRPLGR